MQSELPINQFADKLSVLMPVIIKEFARRQVNELYRGKITFPQFLALEYLNSSDQLKMKDLADYMGVTTAAITGIVDRMVRDGYVTRVFDVRDRRIIKVKLTPKGIALVKNVSLERRQMIIKIFGKISDSDRKDYLRILMKIKDIFLKETDNKA